MAVNKNKPPKKAVAAKKATWFNTVCELAGKGVSNSAIATRLGLSPVEFMNLVNWEQNGIQPVAQAIAMARANFEIERVNIKDEILNNPNTSDAVRLKIVREDLKTLEAWAPATRAVKVTVEKESTGFSFDSFSETELSDIVKRSTSSDSNGTE